LNEILKKSKIEKLYLEGNNQPIKIENEITKDGLENMKESLMNTIFLKEISLSCKYLMIKIANQIYDNGCKVLNEILYKSKIEFIDLSCNNII
jgi:hypothetical protein